MSSPFQKGFIDKSPIPKKLVGKQNRLPEELKAKILAIPEDSPFHDNHGDQYCQTKECLARATREQIDKARKQKEDSIFKDIGGRKGMKEMQMKMDKGIATKEEIAAWNKAIQDHKNKKKKKKK